MMNEYHIFLTNDELDKVHADRIDLVEGALVLFELLEGDGSYDIIRIYAPGAWLEVNKQEN
jgi:hypothetical protein